MLEAEYADTWNAYGSVAEMRARKALLDEQCAASGRDPHSIARSLYAITNLLTADPWDSVDAFQEVVGRYREAGIRDFIFEPPTAAQDATCERIVAEVWPASRRA